MIETERPTRNSYISARVRIFLDDVIRRKLTIPWPEKINIHACEQFRQGCIYRGQTQPVRLDGEKINADNQKLSSYTPEDDPNNQSLIHACSHLQVQSSQQTCEQDHACPPALVLCHSLINKEQRKANPFTRRMRATYSGRFTWLPGYHVLSQYSYTWEALAAANRSCDSHRKMGGQADH